MRTASYASDYSLKANESGIRGTTSANKMLLVGAAVAVILVVVMVSAVVFVSVALRARIVSQRKATESSTSNIGFARGVAAVPRVEHASLLEEVAQLEMTYCTLKLIFKTY